MMKRILLPLALMIILLQASGQAPRLVLHEEFTSSTCGPCVSANTKFKQWMTQYPDIYTPIFYHVNWPSPGNDPMYADNPSDNNARVSYYSVSYVPYAVVDGNYWTGNGSSLAIGTIQSRSNVPSPFTIQLQEYIPSTRDSIYLTMILQATQPITASMVAHNVVIEKNIHFNTAPGSNGEKDFPNVMKKMLPTKDGKLLAASYGTGDYTIIETSWAYENVYDTAQVAAIGFIQNKNSKEVFQAANSSTAPLVMPYDNDLEPLKIENVSPTNCSGKISPVLTVRNNGNDQVSSFEVKYSVNNGTLSSYTWNGNIGALDKSVINLPEITFDPQDNNTLKIFTTSPNLANDQYPKNDTLTMAIAGADVTHNMLLVNIRTDEAPGEVSWQVLDMNGAAVGESETYTIPNHVYKDTVYLPTAGCYTFIISDEGGNGLCCVNGNGLYQVLDNYGNLIHTGNSFGSAEVFEFSSDYMQAIENHERNSLTISPNPFHETANVNFSLDAPGSVTFRIYDLCGKVIKSTDAGYFYAGKHDIELNAAGIVPGLYILQLTSGSNTHSRRISVR